MKTDTYKKEIIDTMQKIVKTMPAYKELVFFVKAVRSHYLADFEAYSPKIIVLGSNIPEELVFASGVMLYWILGGSRSSSMWADDLVPRDTDSVSRSGLGYWPMAYGQMPGDVMDDEEGLATMKYLGQNMAYLLKRLKGGGENKNLFCVKFIDI